MGKFVTEVRKKELPGGLPRPAKVLVATRLPACQARRLLLVPAKVSFVVAVARLKSLTTSCRRDWLGSMSGLKRLTLTRNWPTNGCPGVALKAIAYWPVELSKSTVIFVTSMA